MLACTKTLKELILRNNVYVGGCLMYQDDEFVHQPSYAETVGWLDDVLEGQCLRKFAEARNRRVQHRDW